MGKNTMNICAGFAETASMSCHQHWLEIFTTPQAASVNLLSYPPAPYLSRDTQYINMSTHDVITWKRFLYYWPFVREINQSLVDSFGKSLWYGALMFPLLLGWIKCWTNSRVAFLFQMTLYSCGVTVMTITCSAMDPGGHLNIKMLSYQNRDFHYKDRLTTVLSLWWNSPHLERTALY